MMGRPVIASMSVLLIIVICCHTSLSLRYPPRKNDAVVGGGWSCWTTFGNCSKTCGKGNLVRYRVCNNPRPNNGGKYCVGERLQRIDCNSHACPANGGWSDWVNFGDCSKSCGKGERISYRRCDNPVPNDGGKTCIGESVQRIACNDKPCPANGGWGDWVNFGECSKSCGKGERISYRRCDNPVPNDGGKTCIGESVQRIACDDKPCQAMKDCTDYYNDGQRTDGVYTIHPDGKTAVKVYCDMTGGGSTVIHRRYDGSTSFYDKKWTDYKNGFGNTEKEYWLGLENIHLLTKTARNLMVEMKRFDSNGIYVAHYSTFKVGDESSGYKLTVGGYSGNAGESLKYNSGNKFSTLDKDNDVHSSVHCFRHTEGAWWHKDCGYASLNSRYRNSRSSYGDKTMHWVGVDSRLPLQSASMKLR